MGWLRTTRGAIGFYEGRGWNMVERFEVDLRKWVDGDGLGYGVYWVGFGIRLPREKLEEREGDAVVVE